MAQTAALIVAAGRGERFGARQPKQYAPLADRPLLAHALAAFAHHPRVGRTLAVIRAEDRALYDEAARGLALPDPVIGGQTRQDSVRRGLEALALAPPDRVLIHDGARPLIGPEVIDRVVAALEVSPAAIPALPLADSLKRAREGRIVESVARAGLWRAQTPQGFDFAAILAAHRGHLGEEATDDAALAEEAGLSVAVVEGSRINLKVTTREDLEFAARWMTGAARETRVGQGFDVHRFADGRPLRLCGVEIPHDRGLAGHSDADVGLHAVTDALLGALGAGDIGHHFPPSDPTWRDADSAQFVGHAASLLAARDGTLSHLDVTLICERPRIGPFRQAMIERLAALLAVPPGRISVKATTTEGLGFTGRGEGIAAQAVATVALPQAEPSGNSE